MGVRRPRPGRHRGAAGGAAAARATPARNTAADHITVIRAALRQLPGHRAGHRPGRKVLIRVDGAGATHELLDWLRRPAAVLLGRVQPDPSTVVDQLAALPEPAWQPAYDADGEPRPGAVGHRGHRAARPVRGWPAGMRVIVRQERPHPGAQLRLTDPDGHRLHRVRHQHPPPAGPAASSPTSNCATAAAPAPRTASAPRRTPGCATCPLHELDQNRIWRAIVALACEITAWTQLLALTEHPARRWEPKRLRLRIFSLPAQLARTPAASVLHLPAHAPWAELARSTASTRLRALAVPG